MSTAQFESIFHGLGPTPGKLRIAPSGLGWKSSDEKESVITVPSSDIKWIQWIRVARNFQLRIGTPKNRITFDGFLKDDFERLGNLCKQYYNTTIETTDTSVRGWNWGVAEIQAQDMAFLVAGKQAFTLPLAQVNNTSINKAEVALEFTSALAPKPGQEENEDAVARKKRLKAMPDEVAEMRFYLPGSARGMKKKTDKVKAEGAKDGKNRSDDEDEDDDDEDDDEDENGEEATAAQAFHDAVKEKADIGKITGESFCTIPEALCLTPRGRFDLDMHAEFLRLRGKTYDYRIAYTQIQKLFLLPKPDDIHCQFIVNIDPPIRQGQTRYPYLVMQFIKEEQLELDLNLDEETIKDKYDGNLKLHYDDPAYEVVSVLFRVMAQKKVTTPGSFQSHDGQQAVKCNLKANEGLLYPLEKQLLFISKQPTLVPHADISAVIFARVGGALPSARTFDLSIRLRGDPDHPIVFSALNKEELQPIEDFLRMKKIKIKNEMDEIAAVEAAVLGADDSDEEDEEEDDEDGDVKMKTVKNGGGAEEDDEDEDSPDEDFTVDSDDSDGGSATSDDSGSEMDSDDAGEDSEEEAKKPAKKKQKTG
ncbi:BZ3500_MvSof-1268-A1-R1_Chr1-3g01704 [Microbotryum saponariae]|uniref:FACT complex subunit POB3 n=1 Tax=Microbotryum saponariae TaxID=289078 RepID=A0A2X0K9V6_9BASI|nr:BZ3500_MvSof-1268-A1-R1_Chr1-3g01704 [Microbotryum saponariae]SCZ94373.1 BZ3501_MvSof-1269-A2-R1_Chr1-3g01305 [Microbotryum saponariae]